MFVLSFNLYINISLYPDIFANQIGDMHSLNVYQYTYFLHIMMLWTLSVDHIHNIT